jgi:dimeric dUTPase (all-alpha-NTP-PPase superfamily)
MSYGNMKHQLMTMLSLQDQINTKVNADWREKNFEWYRAIWTECAELMDHYGWKWWKNQQPDIAQAKLELVDIWHFGLSILLVSEQDVERIADSLVAQWHGRQEEKLFRDALEDFTLTTLQTHGFDFQKFCVLLNCIEMTFEELYEIYVGKNVLNMFRQDHGYQQGTYIKLWAGREDNEHLVEIAAQIGSHHEDYQHLLYQGLLSRYQNLKS